VILRTRRDLEGRSAHEPTKRKFKHGYEASYDNSPLNLQVYNTAKRLAKKNPAFRYHIVPPAVPDWLKANAYEVRLLRGHRVR